MIEQIPVSLWYVLIIAFVIGALIIVTLDTNGNCCFWRFDWCLILIVRCVVVRRRVRVKGDLLCVSVNGMNVWENKNHSMKNRILLYLMYNEKQENWIYKMSRKIGTDQHYLRPILRELEKNKEVERINSENKRRKAYQITTKGKKKLEQQGFITF